ncbi:MAG: hypothetical protein IT236_12700 [Bacteroidia bacterium]|nr:hypothetical protein [Bacteroidia bacterium]
MKTIHAAFFLFLMLTGKFLLAQEIETKEFYGRTLNAGAGIGYYNYVGYPVQTAHIDYELQIDRNITAAPFVSMYAYSSTYLWGDAYNVGKIYKYNETVVPMGLKITYYFDDLLKAGTKWDFYSSGSLGFIYRKTTWESSYQGKNQIDPGMGPLYIDLHIGTEFHVNKTVGLALDISTGRSTLALAFHLP